jgi:hypothetical protein
VRRRIRARTMRTMSVEWAPQVAFIAAAGVAVGLWLLVRGLTNYQDATRIGDTAVSRIATLAAGEVQVSGVIEPAELTLISPLQSATCVYYRSTIDAGDDGSDPDSSFNEERAVGFRVRDASGDIRVFPRGARWDAPVDLDEATGLMGDEPAGLQLRTGMAIAGTELDREAAIAALTTMPTATRGTLSVLGGAMRGSYLGIPGRRRRYREELLTPGDAVTIVGRAMPFGDLGDPNEADIAIGSGLAEDDPEIAGDIAEARSVGLLADSVEEAWGNAAIPGFGIGQPVRPPDLDPAAERLPLGSAAAADAAQRRFAIAPETLVLASAPGVPLLIAHGLPSAAVERQQGRFLVGLLGAVVAIASAMALALTASQMIGR